MWVGAQVEGDVAEERESVEVVELGDAEVEREVAVEVEGAEGAEGEGEEVVEELEGLADWKRTDRMCYGMRNARNVHELQPIVDCLP